MRCFILIPLFFAVASASYLNKNRFYRMLNGNQQQPSWYNNDLSDDVFGNGCENSYMDQYGNIRCQQDTWALDDGQWDDEYSYNGKYTQDLLRRTDLYTDDQWNVQCTGQQCTGPMSEIRDANHKLASKLYKQTKEDKDDKNTVVSPLSVQLALAALNQGARGNTKRQIGRVIGGSLQKQERQQIFKQLIRQVKGQRGELSTFGFSKKINPVTIIVINKRTPAQQWFVQVVRGQLDTQVKHCNFHNQPQQCRQMINNMIAQKTNMKINQIVPRDAITDNTKMVLVNALEMKAPWGRQMRNHVTKEAKFHPLDTNKVKIVEVMETQGRFKYYEDELVKIVGIPTKQREMTFYTIVPKYKDVLTAVEKLHLQDGEQLKQLLKKTDLHTRQVGVQLPKFQIKHKIDVRRTLQKEGVTDAFDSMRADFSGITGVSKNTVDEIEDNMNNRFGFENDFQNEYGLMGENVLGLGDKKLHLNKFIHQATIKVNENGITAATQFDREYDSLDNFQRNVNRFDQLRGFDLDDNMYTLGDMTGLMGGDMMGQKMVKANRAFAFVVKHNPTDQLVLVGRVIDAAQKNCCNNAFQTINNVDQL